MKTVLPLTSPPYHHWKLPLCSRSDNKDTSTPVRGELHIFIYLYLVLSLSLSRHCPLFRVSYISLSNLFSWVIVNLRALCLALLQSPLMLPVYIKDDDDHYDDYDDADDRRVQVDLGIEGMWKKEYNVSWTWSWSTSTCDAIKQKLNILLHS